MRESRQARRRPSVGQLRVTLAVAPRPATLLEFHRRLVRHKYRALCSSSRRGKLGPKGPSEELARAIVELKRSNPSFGCPRIALIIGRTFSVEEIKTVAYVPLFHPFVERLIGTISRELLNQTLFWNSVDLASKLLEFRDYYLTASYFGRNKGTHLLYASNNSASPISLLIRRPLGCRHLVDLGALQPQTTHQSLLVECEGINVRVGGGRG